MPYDRHTAVRAEVLRILARMTHDDITARLRHIWADVLNLTTIEDHDHFLELGGDSIAATLCVSAVARDFNVELPLATLFLADMTLVELAAFIEKSRAQTEAAALEPLDARR